MTAENRGDGALDALRPGPDFVEKGAQGIRLDDVRRVLRRAAEIRRRFRRGPLARFVREGALLVSLMRDYWQGTYRSVPYGTLAAVAFTLLYILNPLDLVPDVLPVVGQLDDASVLSAALLLIEQDLARYRRARGRAARAGG